MSEFKPDVDHTFDELTKNYAGIMDVDERGFGVDKEYGDIYYVPENVKISLGEQTVAWTNSDGSKASISLQPHITYVLPSGYKVEMAKLSAGETWRLIGTTAEGTFCHKPCTVSGGGKSEISKSLQDAMIAGPVYVQDLKSDLKLATGIVERAKG